MTGRGHAVTYNGIRYWLGLSLGTIRYYVAQRRWAALVRATWLTVCCGYYLQVCEVCGRKVAIVWHADDDLYQRITGAGAGGDFCPQCFDSLAERVFAGYLVWEPRLVSRDGSR